MASSSSPHHSGRVAKFIQGEGILKMPPKDLSIIWGKDNRYWNIPDEEGWPAELYQVSWLEVTGSVDEINSDKNYEVRFRVSLTPDAFGWGKHPMYLMVKKGKEGKTTWTKILIDLNQRGEPQIMEKKSEISDKQGEEKPAWSWSTKVSIDPKREDEFDITGRSETSEKQEISYKQGEGKIAWSTKISTDPKRKDEFDVIGESEISEKQVEDPDARKLQKQVEDPDARKLHFGLYEVWSGKWKGGLRIHFALIKESP